ncbi:hypothetical protein BKK47_11870 [Rodentibacter mrazii]|uniref:Uncharacterized protein n=1 Tax=Rodentibacter mrazii TaxID=1908257 RepID=A0A1V3I7B9_9PAST|nr:hypothetical protein [Rodentibacter mrazii]OOF35952.1 hypothetical protein BKK47_11870 [Rodentibacter mrazii]
MRSSTIFTLITMTMLFTALILNYMEKGINEYTYIASFALIIQIFVFIKALQTNNQRKKLENKLKELIDENITKIDNYPTK